jgi:hypothetical protein
LSAESINALMCIGSNLPFLQSRWGMTSANDLANHVGAVLQKPAQDELQALLNNGREELLAREGPSPPWLTALLSSRSDSDAPVEDSV